MSKLWTGSEQEAQSILRQLQASGTGIPRNPRQARSFALDVEREVSTPGSLKRTARLSTGRQRESANSSLIKEMRERRAGNGSDALMALPKSYDPIMSLKFSGIPYDTDKEDEAKRARLWSRLFYSTHHLVPTCIDVYTRYPLVGTDVTCKDKDLAEFYRQLFIEDLNYPNFLTLLGREYWTVGEAFALGQFDDDLGVWVGEELLDPDDIEVESAPLLGMTSYKLNPPKYLVEIAKHKDQHPEEFRVLKMEYPELLKSLEAGQKLGVSSVLLQHIFTQTWGWSTRGVPILMRAFKQLMHEEKLNSAQDAIADRLYAPLILARLGSADMGDGEPWIPDPSELDDFRDDLDMALVSDFRTLVYHYGLDIKTVFGKETVPRFDTDFDRVEAQLLQVFGISPSLLSGGSGGNEAYASLALKADLLNQNLRTYQDYLKRHFKARAEVVAEAQGHYDYEKKGDTRIPIFEEYKEVDPDTGKEYIVRQPKLLTPDLTFRVLNLRDEKQSQDFMKALRDMGIPISDDAITVSVPVDLNEELEKSADEQLKKVVREQQKKLDTYKILVQRGLPIPDDLRAAVKTIQVGKDDLGFVSDDLVGIGSTNDKGDTQGDTGELPEVGNPDTTLYEPNGDEPEPDRTPDSDTTENEKKGLPRQRPDISDEARATMPKSSLRDGPQHLGYRRFVKPPDEVIIEKKSERRPVPLKFVELIKEQESNE